LSMERKAGLRPGTWGMAAGGAAAVLLYAWFLAVDFAPLAGAGDAVVGQAIEALTALAALWGVLLMLVVMDRMLGGASWPRRAGFLLVPAAGLATVFATDYPGRLLCRLSLFLLPLLVAAYLALGRLPPRQAARAQAAALVPMAGLSTYLVWLFVS